MKAGFVYNVNVRSAVLPRLVIWNVMDAWCSVSSLFGLTEPDDSEGSGLSMIWDTE